MCAGDDATSYKCICFNTGELTEEMIENCIEIGKWKDNHNVLFECFWKQKADLLDKANLSDEIFFTVVHSEVWVPTVACCKSLLIGFYDKSVTLAKVEEFTKIERFFEHLSALCCALLQCYPDFTSVRPSEEWIPSLMRHIELYKNEICDNIKCTNAANLIIKMKNSLHLSGDFGIVENLVSTCRKCVLNIHMCPCIEILYIQSP